MRNIRKLLLLAVAAIAAMAFVPSMASAQTVELDREGAVGHCPAVVTLVNHLPSDTTCSIHAITEPGSTADLFNHNGVSEVGFSQCQNEFEAAFDENGHGYIYDQELPESAACGREPCDEAETGATPHRNLAWEAQINEDGPPDAGEEEITVTFCLHPHNIAPGEGVVGTNCTVHLHVNRIGHAYEVESGDDDHTSGCANLGNIIELEGHWVTTPPTAEHPGFLVEHLDDDPA